MAPFIVLRQAAHLLSRRMRQKEQFACLQKDAKFAGAAGLSESVLPSPFEAGSRKRSARSMQKQQRRLIFVLVSALFC